MANLVVSRVCDQECSYCFARQSTRPAVETGRPAFISLPAFEERLDFLDRSGIDQIRLIGGEPTLHPRFPELIRQAQPRGKPILVFSHGFMREKALACLESLPPEACTVLVNMTAGQSGGPSPNELTRRREVLARLGRRAKLGFNLYSPDFALEFCLALIDETGCRKEIRLGLAHPILGEENVHLNQGQYPFVGQKIARFARLAAERGVRVEFDCGFVRCMFAPDDLAALLQMGADIGWRCNPVLDIDLDGQALHCFPLQSAFRIPDALARAAPSLRTALAGQAAPYRTAGIYRECSECGFKRQNECSGGCLAHTMRRFRRANINFRVPQVEMEIKEADYDG